MPLSQDKILFPSCCNYEQVETYGVFIDGDNMNPSYFQKIHNYLLIRGHIILKKVYGDFMEDNMRAWKPVCLEYGIEPIMAWRVKSKNSSDVKMATDVMDILHSHPHLQNFVIVTGDIDLQELCRKIISHKRYVIGISCFLSSTSMLLKNSCSEYMILEHIETLKPLIPSRNGDVLSLSDIITLIRQVLEFSSMEHGMNLGMFKKTLLRYNPSFHERHYGYHSMKEFIQACSPHVYLHEISNGNYYVSIQPPSPPEEK